MIFTIDFYFRMKCVFVYVWLSLVRLTQAHIYKHIFSQQNEQQTLCSCSEMTSTLINVFSFSFTFDNQSRVFLRFSFKCFFRKKMNVCLFVFFKETIEVICGRWHFFKSYLQFVELVLISCL